MSEVCSSGVGRQRDAGRGLNAAGFTLHPYCRLGCGNAVGGSANAVGEFDQAFGELLFFFIREGSGAAVPVYAPHLIVEPGDGVIREKTSSTIEKLYNFIVTNEDCCCNGRG